MGLVKGANIQFQDGTISEDEYARILKIIDTAQIIDFRPLLYIIPKMIVEDKVVQVDVDIAANPLSVEYQILNLVLTEFDVIELKEL